MTNKYFELAKEFYPHIKADAVQAIALGSSNVNHTCNPTCADCQWYSWGQLFIDREKNGEFNELNL
jgi:hypothetical protein